VDARTDPMPADNQLIDDLAAAILDGRPIDWSAADSSAGETARPIVQHLRLVAQVAQVHHDLVPTQTWGHLQLLERIGQGAFGEVFRAWDTRLDREVALKLLVAAPASDPDTERAIIREGRLLARVRHPNVVTIYGAEQIGHQIGLWMEFVRGRTLEHLLREGHRFGSAEIIDIGVELCRAVSAVHAAGLLHRDIKAHNVVRTENGRIVLMDFGAGRELDDRTESDLAGTPLYLAPEVLAGGSATIRSDIYSVGVLLFRLATGAYPVEGRTVDDIRHAHDQGHRAGLRTLRRTVRPAVARAISRAIDPEPERRYESVDAFARDLSALRRRPGMVALRRALAVAAVLLTALIALEVRARRTGEPSSRSGLSGATAASSMVPHPRIVVLPLTNVGESRHDDLIDSVTVGLVRHLDRVDGLTVMSHLTSFMLRDAPRSPADLQRRLNVNLSVEGSARFQDGTLIVQASLVSMETGERLWAGTQAEPIVSEAHLVGTVEALTRTLADSLRLKLGGTQRRYDDVDLEVFQTYLTARNRRDGRGERAREAEALLLDVIDRDPTFAPALAALAATYGYLALYHPTVDGYTMPPARAIQLMQPLIERALKVDPTLAEAHAAAGLSQALALRFPDAERSFTHAIRLEPTLSTLRGDFVLSTLLPWGRVDDALRTLDEALTIDPLSLDLRRILARAQLKAGQYSHALSNCRMVLGRDSTFPFASNFCNWALHFNGQRDEAMQQFQQWAVGPPRRPGVLGYIHAIKGERAEAEKLAAQFADVPLRQAEIYGLMRDTDRAFEALERLARINPLRAADALTQPEIGLRDDPGVQAFRRKLGVPDQP
jgi:TolB-like protein/tetratricopeptide (TPR) repeat protein